MSKNGIFKKDYDIPSLGAGQLDEFDDLEKFDFEEDEVDALNEDTFASALEGDWEAEHDKLLMLEETEEPGCKTPTKFDDLYEKDNQTSVIYNREDNNRTPVNIMNFFQNQNPTKLSNIPAPVPKPNDDVYSSPSSSVQSNDSKFNELLGKLSGSGGGYSQQQQQLSTTPPATSLNQIHQQTIKSSPSICKQLPGNFKTVEELEQEMLNTTPPTSTGDSRTTLNTNMSRVTPTNFQQQQQQMHQPPPPGIIQLLKNANRQDVLNNQMPTSSTINATPQAIQMQQQIEYYSKLLPLLNMLSINPNNNSNTNNNNINTSNNNNTTQNVNQQQQQQQISNQNLANILAQNQNQNQLSLQERQLLLLRQQQQQLLIQQQQEQTIALQQILSSSLQPEQKQLLFQRLVLQHQLQHQQQQQMQQQITQLLQHQQHQQQQQQQQQQHQHQQMKQNEDSSQMSPPYNDQRNRQSNRNDNYRNNNNNNNNRNQNRYDNQNRYKNQNNRNQRNDDRNNNNRNRRQYMGGDRLAGIMTDKEKNWVVSVQMMQLQVEDPYKSDFYYTAWMMKKKEYSTQNFESALKMPASILQNRHDPRTYKPITFENSLGKVTLSNFHHPRALIDLNKVHSDAVDDKHKETKSISTILLEIEKMYQVYLEIDETEHHILKTPEDQRVVLFHDRRAKVDKLATMLCSENFAHYLFITKGKRLLNKCIPMFNPSQTKSILDFLIQHIYIISKNNITLDEAYSQISYAIDTQKFTDLVEIVGQFVHLYSMQPLQIYNTIFMNKFGLTYLLKFVSKSELINQDDYETDVKNIWASYLTLILNALLQLTIQHESMNSNLQLQVYETCNLNVKIILEEFHINPELWLRNENKLKELFSLVYN